MDRVKAIEEKLGTFQKELREVQELQGVKSGGVKAELEARAKEFNEIKKKVQAHLDGMNDVIQRNAEKARENADKLVEKVSGRVDKALADAREATKYLESERAQMKKAVDEFAGLDDHVTTCFKKEVRKVESLKGELQDSARDTPMCSTNWKL